MKTLLEILPYFLLGVLVFENYALKKAVRMLWEDREARAKMMGDFFKSTEGAKDVHSMDFLVYHLKAKLRQLDALFDGLKRKNNS